MKSKSLLVLCLPLLLSCLPYTRFSQFKTNTPNGLPVHNLNTGLNYTTIHEAISASETLDGHTIGVNDGAYYEHVNISKSIFLLGESRNTTIIDGSGTGPVVTLSANNVSVANFTIRNGGHSLSPQATCIRGDSLVNILIESNTVTDVSNGIIFYSLQNSSMRYNLAEECGVMGLHLDSSANCKMVNNTVTDSFQGIVVEKSAGNFVQGNNLISNSVGLQLYACAGNLVEQNNFVNSSVGIVLDACNGSNSFRSNNLASDGYNLIVWGSSLEAFMQNVDTSNIVDNRTTYYVTDSQDLILDPINCPNIGYLALVNCTKMTVKDIDFSDDKDGVLMAQSTNCSLINVTLANAHMNITLPGFSSQPLIHGGLDFFKSNNNLMTNSRITNNSVGICLYQSSGNLFYHNMFVEIDQPVISNFQSPGLPTSGSYSLNEWDNGLEGNYWRNCNATDSFGGPYQNASGSDGIGDTPYFIDANNTDHYPLMGSFHNFTVSTPSVGYQSLYIISNSTVSSPLLLTWLSSPYNGLQPGQQLIQFTAAGENGTVGFCRLMIPRTVLNSSSYIVLVDSRPVNATELPISNDTFVYMYFTYTHSTHEVIITISEFSSLMLPLSMIATVLAVLVYRRKSMPTRRKHSAD